MKIKKDIQRTFIPGSEWVYVKIYAGSSSLDKILINELSRFVNKLKKEGAIKKWFFIRYSDSDFHIRLRVLIKEAKQIGNVMSTLYTAFQPLMESNIIWKIQIDTYNRELERYDENLMEQTESLFYIDSMYSIKLLKILKESTNPNYRWIIALKMIDCLLEDFGYSINKKNKLLESMDNAFKTEFGYNQYNMKQLNMMYRKYSKEIEENIMENRNTKVDKILHERSINNIKISNEMMVKGFRMDVDYFMTSYIHMMLNRLFCSKNRIYELLLYNFLSRFYKSRIARLI